jgi:hypothetical protein
LVRALADGGVDSVATLVGELQAGTMRSLAGSGKA